MAQLIALLTRSISVALLDVDNALYMTSVIDPLPAEEQIRDVRLGLVVEFLVRLGMVLLFSCIAIRIELITQGLGAAVPEQLFNGVMLLALFVAIIYQLRYTDPQEPTS